MTNDPIAKGFARKSEKDRFQSNWATFFFQKPTRAKYQSNPLKRSVQDPARPSQLSGFSANQQQLLG